MPSSQFEPAAHREDDPAFEPDTARMKPGDGRHAEAMDVLDVVNSIVASIQRDIPSIDAAVRDDLKELASYIRDTKYEILNLNPEQICGEYLPSASVELDAIVDATEHASHTIMAAAERIELVGDELGGDAAQRITDATTRIYEACGFQDITGQRIGKIVIAMKEIENKIDDLINVFGDDDETALVEHRRIREIGRDEKRQEAIAEGELLAGPQLPEAAPSQDDIDSLFDSL